MNVAATNETIRGLGISGSLSFVLASVAALIALAALHLVGHAASLGIAVDLTPDKGFVVAAIVILQAYLALTPGSGS